MEDDKDALTQRAIGQAYVELPSAAVRVLSSPSTALDDALVDNVPSISESGAAVMRSSRRAFFVFT